MLLHWQNNSCCLNNYNTLEDFHSHVDNKNTNIRANILLPVEYSHCWLMFCLYTAIANIVNPAPMWETLAQRRVWCVAVALLTCPFLRNTYCQTKIPMDFHIERWLLAGYTMRWASTTASPVFALIVIKSSMEPGDRTCPWNVLTFQKHSPS